MEATAIAVWQPNDWKEARSITFLPSFSLNLSHIRNMSPQSAEPAVPTASASSISPTFCGLASASRDLSSKLSIGGRNKPRVGDRIKGRPPISAPGPRINSGIGAPKSLRAGRWLRRSLQSIRERDHVFHRYGQRHEAHANGRLEPRIRLSRRPVRAVLRVGSGIATGAPRAGSLPLWPCGGSHCARLSGSTWGAESGGRDRSGSASCGHFFQQSGKYLTYAEMTGIAVHPGQVSL